MRLGKRYANSREKDQNVSQSRKGRKGNFWLSHKKPLRLGVLASWRLGERIADYLVGFTHRFVADIDFRLSLPSKVNVEAVHRLYWWAEPTLPGKAAKAAKVTSGYRTKNLGVLAS